MSEVRLIDANALKEAMRKAKRRHYSAFSDVTLQGIYQVIDNATTVEPEKKLFAEIHFDEEQLQEIVDKAKAEVLASIERPQGEWVRKEDIIHYIATQYSEHNELVPIWLSIGDLKGGTNE